MLSKSELECISKCSSHGGCNVCCKAYLSKCNKDSVAQTALHLLNRVETAETILRDILQSGNVAACKKEIEGFLNNTK